MSREKDFNKVLENLLREELIYYLHHAKKLAVSYSNSHNDLQTKYVHMRASDYLRQLEELIYKRGIPQFED